MFIIIVGIIIGLMFGPMIGILSMILIAIISAGSLISDSIKSSHSRNI